MDQKTVADVIETAIGREEDAYHFYTDLKTKVADDAARDTIGFIAEEEKKHKAFLVAYREGKYGSKSLRMIDVVDYSVAEHQEEPDVGEDMQSTDVFLVAAHRELRSHKFYTGLAEMHSDAELRDMLLRMANEELKHKEKMEYLYANTAFRQTSGG